MQDFSKKLDSFYDDFQKSKKVFLDEAATDPLRIENDRLRRELKANDEENDSLRRDLYECRSTIKSLEAELKTKNDVLSAIGAYARQNPDAKLKREHSPVADIDCERKRSREDFAGHGPDGYYDFGKGDMNGYDNSTPSSGYGARGPYGRGSHTNPATVDPPWSNSTSYSNGARGPSYPPTYPTSAPGGYELHPQSELSVAGAAQFGKIRSRCKW